MASPNHNPSPTSLSTPLLSDTITPTPTRVANGHAHRHHDDDDDSLPAAPVCDGGNPFAFLSEDRPPRPRGASPADPFRNGTPAWGDTYGWAKALLCALVAAVRLVLFGLAIAVGYATTWVALRGWADAQGRQREGAGA